jgi:hypothetical protein
LAGAHISALLELSRVAEAEERGLAYVDASQRHEISTTGQLVFVATAEALARRGRFDEAVAMLDPVIALAQERGQTGISIGSMCEARARIAVLMKDRPGFERYAGRCADEFRKGTSPFLAAKFARLIEDARQRDLGALPPMAALENAGATQDGEFLTVHSRMLECVDEDDRARCALTMLLQDLESFAGALFGVNHGTPSLLAILPEDDGAEAEAIERWLAQLIRHELQQPEASTADSIDDDDEREHRPPRFIRLNGRRYEPLFLTCTQDGQQVLAAVLAFHRQASSQHHPHRERLEEIARQLIDHRDVSGIAIVPLDYTVTRRG